MNISSLIKDSELNKGRNFIMLVGPPGSGKSFIANNIMDETEGNWVVICPDDIRQELCGDAKDQSHNQEVFATVYTKLKEYLKRGCNVVYDATNCRPTYRFKILDVIKGYSNKNICAVSTTPIATCLRNNEKRSRVVPENVIERMYFTLKKHPPTIFEGFDIITSFQVKEDH